MDYRCAAPLNPGDTIAVVAPSAALAEDDAAQGIAFLKELGYQVAVGKSVSAHDGYLAGSDELRAADINAAFADDQVKAIICLRGGYGATRILPLLDYDLIAAHPKFSSVSVTLRPCIPSFAALPFSPHPRDDGHVPGSQGFRVYEG